jgi:hypothetical protein
VRSDLFQGVHSSELGSSLPLVLLRIGVLELLHNKTTQERESYGAAHRMGRRSRLELERRLTGGNPKGDDSYRGSGSSLLFTDTVATPLFILHLEFFFLSLCFVPMHRACRTRLALGFEARVPMPPSSAFYLLSKLLLIAFAPPQTSAPVPFDATEDPATHSPPSVLNTAGL